MNKIHYILRKLNLSEGLSLLDIGCGWGGLLIEAAKIYKIRGLGITLSEEQYKAFKERIEKESLQEYLDVKLMDYRELENSKLSFDRIVSVGMIEHVGRPNYDLFFKNVNVVLKESGLFLLHYISGLKESEGDAWIKKYIFPGGVIPSLREIISISSEYKYHILDVESLRLHYKKTLLMWAKNFDNNKRFTLLSQGYDVETYEKLFYELKEDILIKNRSAKNIWERAKIAEEYLQKKKVH